MSSRPRLDTFSCKQCGRCCRWSGFVYLTDEDVGSLSRELGMAEDRFLAEYTELAPNRAQLRLASHPEAPCVFLSGNVCSVYPGRPRQCRDFPHKWSAPVQCPGVG